MQKLAPIYNALGNETRLRLLKLIAQHHQMCVCELVEQTGLSQSNVSYHLATLHRAGLVDSRNLGTWVVYSLNLPLLDKHSPELAVHFRELFLESDVEEVEERIRERCQQRST